MPWLAPITKCAPKRFELAPCQAQLPTWFQQDQIGSQISNWLRLAPKTEKMAPRGAKWVQKTEWFSKTQIDSKRSMLATKGRKPNGLQKSQSGSLNSIARVQCFDENHLEKPGFGSEAQILTTWFQMAPELIQKACTANDSVKSPNQLLV